MIITKNKFIDMGNGLKINADLMAYYDNKENVLHLKNGEHYKYGEFMKTTPTLCENCFDSEKGDYYWDKDQRKRANR